MDEAFNYINYLKNKIEELSGRRNELKKLSNLSVLSPGNERVIVHPIRDGVEILVSSNVNEGLLPSEVLEILLNEGLGVERYLSTRANERLCYTIISQVCLIIIIHLFLGLGFLEIVLLSKKKKKKGFLEIWNYLAAGNFA